jgi:hypothetical protein
MTFFVGTAATKVEIIKAGEHGELHGMIGRTRRDGFVHVTTSFANEARAEGQAPLALTKPRAKTGVSLDGFDVAITTLHRGLELMERDVFTTTNEGFHGRVSEGIVETSLVRPKVVGIWWIRRV